MVSALSCEGWWGIVSVLGVLWACCSAGSVGKNPIPMHVYRDRDPPYPLGFVSFGGRMLRCAWHDK